jgi:Domain of unknown function (DUF2382)
MLQGSKLLLNSAGNINKMYLPVLFLIVLLGNRKRINTRKSMAHNEFNNDQTGFEEININRLVLTSDIQSQEIIPLLEERMVVSFTQRKMGEIVVRKAIETNTVTINIPVRSERLIIEQVNPTYKLIATVDLGEPASMAEQNFYKNHPEILKLVDNVEVSTNTENISLLSTVKAEVNSLEDAHIFVDSIFNQMSDDCRALKIELTLRKQSFEAK